MTEPTEPRTSGPLERRSPVTQWALLLLVSLLIAALLELIGLPAAFLLGPMLGGILFGINGATIRMARPPALAGQTIVGCLMGHALTADIVISFVRDWPLLLGVVLVILLTSGLLGWMMSQRALLPGTTAIWGVAPGAASAMMIMAGEFGADARLVALMQYLRVVCVAGLASIVARIWVGPIGVGAHGVAWFPPLPLVDFAATIALAAIAGTIGVLVRFPAGALFVPLFASAVLGGMEVIHIVLPPWLLAISYAALGWSIGLGFTRANLAHARRALPQILLSIFILIAVCGALAFVLVRVAGIDPLTAYLATSPGGMDSIAIIGASSKVDLAFVMAMQTVRFLVVLAAGPPLARFMAKRVRPRE